MNPVFPEKGLTDPHAIEFDGRLYIVCGHDISWSTDYFWAMDRWEVWSTDDLVNWRRETVILPENSYMGRRKECYGTDLARRGDWFYLYFSNGCKDIGVLRAPSPAGPFEDVLGKPLIPQGLIEEHAYDPDVYEEDGVFHIIFGNGRYHIARLGEDMVSLAEAPRPIVVEGVERVSDKACVFKREGLYYLSWGKDYATSDCLTGPYQYRGFFIDGGHANAFSWKGQLYLAHETQDIGLFYRGFSINFLKFRDDGSVYPQPDDSMGVGACDASRARLWADEFYEASEGIFRRESPAPGAEFELRGLRDRSWVRFQNVFGVAPAATLTVEYSRGVECTASIEIRRKDASGTLLGILPIAATGSWDNYATTSCKLSNRLPREDLCFVLRSANAVEGEENREGVRLTWFSFRPEAQPLLPPPVRDWHFQLSAMGWRAVQASALDWEPLGFLRWRFFANGNDVPKIESGLWPVENLDRNSLFVVRLRHGCSPLRLRAWFAVVPDKVCWFWERKVQWNPEHTVIMEFAAVADEDWVQCAVPLPPLAEGKLHLQRVGLEWLDAKPGQIDIDRVVINNRQPV